MTGKEGVYRLAAGAPPENVESLYRAMGAALFQCQNVENRLAEFIVVMYDGAAAMTKDEAWRRVDALNEGTIGSLIRELRKRANLSSETSELFKEFLNERNWLAHSVARENGLDAYDPQRFARVLKRISEISDRAMHLQRELVKLVVEFVIREKGVTSEQLDSAQLEVLKCHIATGKTRD